MKKLLFIALLPLQVLASSLDYTDLSGETQNLNSPQNIQRTKALVEKVEDFLVRNNVLVAVMSRRGAPEKSLSPFNPNPGLKSKISDVDSYDATGLAHTGFVIRTTLTGNKPKFVTFNMVRVKGEKGDDTSDLRVWSLEQFFYGDFEKDAGIFVPQKDVQTALWTQLLDGGQVKIEKKLVQVGGKKVERPIVVSGLFAQLHNTSYSLLSDFANEKSQNCNEHAIKVIVSAQTGIIDLQELSQIVEQKVVPYDFQLSGMKKLLANLLGYNIRRNERVVGGVEKIYVVTAEVFASPLNKGFFNWSKTQFFREYPASNGNFTIFDRGADFRKANVKTGALNPLGVHSLR